MSIEAESYKHLLSHTESLMNYVCVVQQNFGFQPDRNHYGMGIVSTDALSRREQFVQELSRTAASWVYNKAMQLRLFNGFLAETNDPGYAALALQQEVKKRFRPNKPQGQFGELLLFNLLQHFWKAVPVVRKMTITTNPKLERNGADGIHYSNVDGEDVFFIGESKCYLSKYQFRAAFEESLTSIIESCNSFFSELNRLFVDEFVEEELRAKVDALIKNKLENPKIDLVCIITYHEQNISESLCGDDLRKHIADIITERAQKLPSSVFQDIANNALKKITYIIFPVNKLDNLLDAYCKELGVPYDE